MRSLQARRNLRFVVLTLLMSLGIFLFLQCVHTFYVYYSGVVGGGGFQQQQQQFAQEALQLKSFALVNDSFGSATDFDQVAPPTQGDLPDSRENKVFDVSEIDPAVLRTRALKQLLKCTDRPLVTERLQYGDYWMVRNLVRGTLSTRIGCAESITYTTNGDYTFFDNLATVTSRWLGPVSFALYTPGYDLNGTLDAIQYVRNCLPESALIVQYVSFHIFFPAQHMPEVLPHSEQEALQWPYDCEVRVPPYVDVKRDELYKSAKNLTYPINVGRNIARKAANTYFIFACDIELYPSPGLLDQFLDLVWRNASAVLAGDKPRVFPMPVFELESNATLPYTKEELVNMLDTKLAVPFHFRLCATCHMVPNQTQWLQYNQTDELAVFAVGKRYDKFKFWEPFYISDNREPMFDERVTWEGQKNKRIQGFAMCLLDYEYHVLHPAFLVHHPGIKTYNKQSPRIKYVPAMNLFINNTIEPEYRVLYGNNSRCKT